MREISYGDAIREAIIEEMKRDNSIITLGEDIGVMGGAFQVTKGLLEIFGPDRIITTPISEIAIIGSAIGSSRLST
ncbi:MAG: alpha-ketoacid dehydrogenase subunit beta, partial [Cyanobacteria bacterium]|nr:alpha-ketoacid dehydrogenase subunit beta [Cyanobacteriota bacterium]